MASAQLAAHIHMNSVHTCEQVHVCMTQKWMLQNGKGTLLYSPIPRTHPGSLIKFFAYTQCTCTCRNTRHMNTRSRGGTLQVWNSCIVVVLGCPYRVAIGHLEKNGRNAGCHGGRGGGYGGWVEGKEEEKENMEEEQGHAGWLLDESCHRNQNYELSSKFQADHSQLFKRQRWPGPHAKSYLPLKTLLVG